MDIDVQPDKTHQLQLDAKKYIKCTPFNPEFLNFSIDDVSIDTTVTNTTHLENVLYNIFYGFLNENYIQRDRYKLIRFVLELCYKFEFVVLLSRFIPYGQAHNLNDQQLDVLYQMISITLNSNYFKFLNSDPEHDIIINTINIDHPNEQLLAYYNIFFGKRTVDKSIHIEDYINDRQTLPPCIFIQRIKFITFVSNRCKQFDYFYELLISYGDGYGHKDKPIHVSSPVES